MRLPTFASCVGPKVKGPPNECDSVTSKRVGCPCLPVFRFLCRPDRGQNRWAARRLRGVQSGNDRHQGQPAAVLHPRPGQPVSQPDISCIATSLFSRAHTPAILVLTSIRSTFCQTFGTLALPRVCLRASDQIRKSGLARLTIAKLTQLVRSRPDVHLTISIGVRLA